MPFVQDTVADDVLQAAENLGISGRSHENAAKVAALSDAQKEFCHQVPVSLGLPVGAENGEIFLQKLVFDVRQQGRGAVVVEIKGATVDAGSLVVV